MLVRVDPAASETLIVTTAAEPMEMRGKVMHGWLRIGAGDVRTKRQLATWVQRGSDYAASLPKKAKGRK